MSDERLSASADPSIIELLADHYVTPDSVSEEASGVVLAVDVGGIEGTEVPGVGAAPVLHNSDREGRRRLGGTSPVGT